MADDVTITEEHLVFAATERCVCGAGLAHFRGAGPRGSWECSRVLLQRVNAQHSPPMPFTFYEIKSENQPGAQGQTTRPLPLAVRERAIALALAGAREGIHAADIAGCTRAFEKMAPELQSEITLAAGWLLRRGL